MLKSSKSSYVHNASDAALHPTTVITRYDLMASMDNLGDRQFIIEKCLQTRVESNEFCDTSDGLKRNESIDVNRLSSVWLNRRRL